MFKHHLPLPIRETVCLMYNQNFQTKVKKGNSAQSAQLNKQWYGLNRQTQMNRIWHKSEQSLSR